MTLAVFPAVIFGIIALLIAVAVLLWRERGAARQWEEHALAAQQQVAQAHAKLALAAQPAPAMAEVASIREIVAALTALTEMAASTTEILERQRKALSDLQAAREALPRSSMYDPLTGAITHTALMTRLATDVAFAVDHDRPLALVVFDIDGFRAINTRYGHRFGDEVLFAVAERFREKLAEGDLLARLGSDRFAIVRAGQDFPGVQQLVEQIVAAVSHAPLLVLHEASPIPGHHEQVRVTLRAGLALCPDDGTTADELLRTAESALSRETPPNLLRDEGLPPDAYASPPGAQMSPDLGNRAQRAPSAPLAAPYPISYIDDMTQRHSSIHALTAALEAHDMEAVAHARNLAELAQETALLMGRSIEESRLVGLAALLHDVGNLGIPVEILQKTEPLTAEEWAFVREHPHLGERLLTSVGGVLAAIAPIVASHRERWDGLGYPAGLRGEAIPLGARIVAVCDVYGALRSSRPYRPALTHEEALAEIQRNAGTQFDPDVVQAFITAAQQ